MKPRVAPSHQPLRDDLAAGLKLVTGLWRVLRNPMSPAEAAAIVRDRLARRDRLFLDHVETGIFGPPDHPIRQLLALAGCEYGDLARMVQHDGVEGCLASLLRHGVYLTVDELKGRRDIVRGSTSFRIEPARLRNVSAKPHLHGQTSGSRGQSTLIVNDLAFERAKAANLCLVLEATGGLAAHHAFWLVPGGGALGRVVQSGACGVVPVRWFSPVPADALGLHPRYRWSERVLRLSSWLAGRSLPSPELVPLEDPVPIARWMTDVLRQGATPCLYTYASLAARLCQEAYRHGIDVSGAHFLVGSEPFTAARRDAIQRVGARVLPGYGSRETGGISRGCLQPEAPDDLHLFHDRIAVIQPGTDGAALGLRPKALLMSSLLPSAPLTLVNYAIGDEAEATTRACGCPFERHGWTTHLQAIRSYEKLTAGGMTFLDTDVIRVLDDVLPARFGGGVADYQLVEVESDDGQPRLRLLVHPRVGPVDEQAVVETFLTAIGPGSGVERLMALEWRQGGRLQVERRPPLATASGKILHLHQERAPVASTPR